MEKYYNRVLIVLSVVAFVSGFYVIDSQHLITVAKSDTPAMVSLANTHPTMGCIAAILLACTVVALIRQIQPAMSTGPFGEFWPRVSFVGCAGAGAGELCSLPVQYFRFHHVDLFLVQHTMLILAIGLIGLFSLLHPRIKKGDILVD